MRFIEVSTEESLCLEGQDTITIIADIGVAVVSEVDKGGEKSLFINTTEGRTFKFAL